MKTYRQLKEGLSPASEIFNIISETLPKIKDPEDEGALRMLQDIIDNQKEASKQFWQMDTILRDAVIDTAEEKGMKDMVLNYFDGA